MTSERWRWCVVNVTEYRQHPAMSYSKLKPYLKSPLHGLTYEPPAESAALRFGSAVDLALKGQIDEVLVNPFEDGRTKAAKEWKAENVGKLVMTQSEMEKVLECSAAVLAHPAVKAMSIEMMYSDIPLFGNFNGVDLKGLPDWFFAGTVIDLKTTSSAVDAASFAKTVDNFHYDLQAAVYCELARQAGESCVDFFWIVVESDKPHDVAVYKASDRILEVGKAKLNHALANFAKAKSGAHLGTSEHMQVLEMPPWYGKSFQLDDF
jgi:hypothetical protein